jgi:RNA polymerase sigma-70 factor (ECF subfamily)
MKNILAIKTLFHPQAEDINWQGVYDDSLPKVYHYFCYKVGDPILAEDLTAITLERAWLSRKNFHSDLGKLQTWLMGIARNVANDHFRKKVREVPLKEESERNLPPFFDEQLQEKWDFEFILSILAQFPERERDLIAYKYGAELNNRQIAKMTGLSETNVGTILHRVVEKLRTEWEEHHER